MKAIDNARSHPAILIALDPGLRRSGVAKFRDGVLVQVVAVPEPHSPDGSVALRAANMAHHAASVLGWLEYAPDEVVVEWPQIYQRGAGKSKGDPNDLLGLAAVDGAFVTLLGRPLKTRAVTPATWKGQAPKNVIEARIRARLAPTELALAEGLPHDAWDAIGIGLWALGRFTRRRGS